MTITTYASLQAQALAIKNETLLRNNTATRVGTMLQGIIDTFAAGGSYVALTAGADAVTAAANTAAFQAAIDVARAAYLAGTSTPDVVLPQGTYYLGASTLAETYWNYGVQVLATDGCISMRDGVRLRGAGIGRTILKPLSPTLDVIHIVDGSNQTISDLEIDGGWTAAGAGHGILQVTSANDTSTAVQNLKIENYYCHDVGSYGIGIENGVFTNVIVRNFRTKNTGADGIDVKNRPFPTNDGKGIVLENLYIENPGRRLDGQTGVDLRGIVLATNITVIGVGRAAVSMTGIRFRTGGTDEGLGELSSVTNFYVRGDNTQTSLGVDIGGPDNNLTGGVVDSCRQGVTIGGNATATAQRNNVTGVTVLSALAEAFYTYAAATNHNKFEGCNAYNSLYGFSVDGSGTQIVGCKAINCTTQHRVSGSAIQSEMLSGNNFEVDFVSTYSVATGRVNIEARGQSTNIDISLNPKGNGLLRFGSFSGVGVSSAGSTGAWGYVSFKDDGGTTRRMQITF